MATVTAQQLLDAINSTFDSNQDVADWLTFGALLLQRGKLDAQIATAEAWQDTKDAAATAYIAARQQERTAVQAELDALVGDVDPEA